jgi:hypothetical protein
MKILERLQLKKLDILAIIIVLILISSVGFYYYYQKIKTQQKIQQLQLELQKIDQELERAKKFNEEEYAEKISKILDLESYFSTSTDIEVEGVEIIKKGDRKLVINHKEGYQIEIPGNLILNQSRNARGLNFDDPELIQNPGFTPKYWTIISIFVWNKDIPESKYFFEEFYNKTATTTEEIVTYPGDYSSTTLVAIPYKLNVNDEEMYKIVTYKKSKNGDLHPIGYLYTLLKEDKLYNIFAHETFEEYIKTFRLIKNE